MRNIEFDKAITCVDTIIRNDIARGFPSAQWAVMKDHRLIYESAQGWRNAYTQDGKPIRMPQAVTKDTLYDLASNTKMYSANYALQYLASRNAVDLDRPVWQILGEEFVTDTLNISYIKGKNPEYAVMKQWKAKITARSLMSHCAGFPPDPFYFDPEFDLPSLSHSERVSNPVYSGNDGSVRTRENTLKAICATPLLYEPGTQVQYSDVDYMLLTFLIEKLTGERLDSWMKKHFWDPLGLKRTAFNPLRCGFKPEEIAATELNGNTRDHGRDFQGARDYTLQGEVHDEKAWYCMGGVSGHAGMFSNAAELAALADLMLDDGKDSPFFAHHVLADFTAPVSPEREQWGLGWWRQGHQKRSHYFGNLCSERTFGHQGWTGTLTMIDPEERLVLVLLTNTINAPVTNPKKSLNTFHGDFYTTADLGFAAKVLYPFLKYADTAECSREVLSVMQELVRTKETALQQENADASSCMKEHPAAKALEAIRESEETIRMYLG